MNSIVANHRAQVPDDQRSDAELTEAYAQNYPQLLPQHPDLQADYNAVQEQRKAAAAPTLDQELGRGAARGTDSLLATGQGAVALAAGAVGADQVRNYFLQKANASEAAAADNAPSVPSVSDVKDISTGARYAAGKLGELAPNLAEAGVTAAIGAGVGAAAGTVEPVGGEVVGAAGGALYGLLERRAISSLIRKGVVKGVEDLTPDLVTQATKNLGRVYGDHLAQSMNFWAQSAGGTYNTLSKNPNVDPATALNVSIYGGLAQAIPAQYLPSTITEKFFGKAAVGDYFARLVSSSAKIIPGGAAALSLQSLASISSQRYADPATRATAFDFSKWSAEDRKQLIDASATGALAGLIGAPIAAIPKSEAKPANDIAKNYTGDQSPARLAQIEDLAQKTATQTLTPADEDAIKTFTQEQRNAYSMAVGNAEATVAPAPSAAPEPIPNDTSGLDATTARIAANPSPLVDHPELSDTDILQALQPRPPEPVTPSAQPGAAQPEEGKPAESVPLTVAPVPPIEPPPAPVTGNPVSDNPALAAARQASAAALSPDAQETRANVAQAAAEVKAEPPAPTASTSEKPQVDIGGIKIAMENAQGGTRTGKSGDFQVEMPAHYGEIVGSHGADGDPVDVYIGPKPEHDRVFVIDQHDPETGKFDEHKVMLGFESAREAEAAYDAAFSDGKGPARRGNISETTKAGLRHWLDNEDTSEPFGKPKSSGKTVGLDDIDFDNSNLVAQETARGQRGGAPVKFEPSYFTIDQEQLKNPEELGERLVSGSRSGEKTDPYQVSKRATAVLDNQTGKVFVLGTFQEQRDGSIKLADPEKIGQRAANTRLGDMLKRYTPIASMRLNEGHRFLVQEFADQDAFEAAIGDEGTRRIESLGSHAEAVGEIHSAGLRERGLNPETGLPPEDVSSGEPSTSEPVESEGFTKSHADALWNVFGGEEEGSLTRERFEELFSTDLRKSRRAIDAMSAAIDSVQAGDESLSKLDALEIVKDKLYESLEAGDREGKEAFKRSALQSFGSESTGRTDSRGNADHPVEASPQQRVPEQPAKDSARNEIPNNPAVVSFRKPEGVQEVTSRHAVLLDSIHRAAIEGGLNVQRVAQDITGMAGDFAKQTGAAYDRASRTVAQVVGAVVGREDVITSLHEVGHDVFSRLDPVLRDRILSAVDSMSDRTLGTSMSSDPRIRSDGQSALSKSALAEERLVEATALRLTDQGFSPNTSRGLAQQFVRALKDLYLRAAMTVQRALFGDSFTNPDLARRFFENKAKAFLAGDFQRTSFIDMLGGGKQPASNRAQWHSNATALFEHLGINGQPEYDHVPDTSMDAARFNDLAFRKPDMPPEEQRVLLETRAALHNHLDDILGRAAKNPEITAALTKSGKTATKYIADLLRIADPAELKKELATAVDEAKQPIQFDNSKSIDDFKGASVSGQVARDAYVNDQALLSKIGTVEARETAAKAEALEKRQKLLDGHEQDKANYTDSQAIVSESQREIRSEIRKILGAVTGTSSRKGAIEQQLRALDPNPDLKSYTTAFRHLLTGGALEGGKLFDVLDGLANDKSIDFSKPISEVRKALALNPKYAEFVQDTKESKALLATVTSFAKTDAKVMAKLEMRRMSNGVEREALVKELDEMRKKFNPLTDFRKLTREAKLSERARVAYRESLKQVTGLNRRAALADERIAVARAVAPIARAEHSKLAGKLGIGVGTVFGDGSKYAAPLTSGASSEAILGERKPGESPAGWQIHTLKLDTSKNSVSNPEEVDAHLRQMKAFLDEREGRHAAGDEGALDTAYQSVKNAFNEIAANKNYQTEISPSSRTITGLAIQGPGQQLEDSFGTPAARAVGTMVRTEAAELFRLQPEVDRRTLAAVDLENKALALLPDKTIDKRKTFRNDFLNPIKREIEAQKDADERFAGNPNGLKAFLYNRAMDTLKTSAATRDIVKGNEAAWRTAIENIVENHVEFNQWFESQVRGEGALSNTVMGREVPTGHRVTDQKLRAVNPVTGKLEAAIRNPIATGPRTFARQMSEGFREMVNALRGAAWAVTDENKETGSNAKSDFSRVAELLKSGQRDQAEQLVGKYFDHAEYGDQVRNVFFKSIAEMNTSTILDAPKEADGVTSFPADASKMKDAYESSEGDAIKFFEELHRLHNGETPIETYVQEGLLRLADVAQEAHNIMQKIEPVGSDRIVGIRGMTSDFALNARKVEHLPGEWFDYHSYDAKDTANMMKRVAAQNAYGPGAERLATAYETVQKEAQAAQAKLKNAQAEVRRQNPTVDIKTFKKLVTEKVGGEKEYDRLNKFNQRADFVAKAGDQLISAHRYHNSPTDRLNLVSKIAHSIGGLMINQPSSAITLLTQLSDITLRYGASGSVLRQVARSYTNFGREVASSLAAAVGVQLGNGGENAERFNRLGLIEPNGIRTFRDNFSNIENVGLGAHFIGSMNHALGHSFDKVGSKGNHVPFTPARIFDFVSAITDKQTTEQVWNLAQLHIGRGLEFYRNNLEKLSEPGFKVTADTLGLKGQAKEGYNLFTNDMLRWGMHMDDVVRNAMERGDGTLLTNVQAARLYSMAMSEIALRGSLANTSAAWKTNSILKAAAPLLAWGFRRGQQIASIPLNAEGKFEMARVRKSLAGIAVAAAGGLAVSALIDQYSQKVLGKQRNITPLAGSDPEAYGLSLMENLSRVGTFGLLGELANTVVGIGQGGDNRDLSLDQRVLAVNSLINVMHVADSFVNQGYNADYAHVIRPLIGAMGGGGLIQYTQIANNALGLDNAEARVTARINAQNYLRVVGRELGMDVRQSAGGNFSPTPVSPYLTQMELAAYKNSPGDFRAAYALAVEAAKKAGHDDAVAYIKSSFSSRNPLRAVFTTAPTEGDYSRLLASMPGSGEADVSSAVHLFNQYAESIGAKAFDGKVAKPTPAPKATLGEIRQRSILALH